MDNRIVFLDIMIFLTFLMLILSNVVFHGIIDPSVILILLLTYILAYNFIYKFGNFQKVLFILSICSFLFFMPLYGYWYFNSYIPLLIILNWYIIWLIFKNWDISNDKYLGVDLFVLLPFIFYLLFNLILINSYGGFSLTAGIVVPEGEVIIWEILGNCLLSLSVIGSMVFVATIAYSKYSSLSHDDIDRFEK